MVNKNHWQGKQIPTRKFTYLEALMYSGNNEIAKSNAPMSWFCNNFCCKCCWPGMIIWGGDHSIVCKQQLQGDNRTFPCCTEFGTATSGVNRVHHCVLLHMTLTLYWHGDCLFLWISWFGPLARSCTLWPRFSGRLFHAGFWWWVLNRKWTSLPTNLRLFCASCVCWFHAPLCPLHFCGSLNSIWPLLFGGSVDIHPQNSSILRYSQRWSHLILSCF